MRVSYEPCKSEGTDIRGNLFTEVWLSLLIYAATAATEGTRSVLEVHGGEGKEATAAIFAGLWEEIYLGWEPNGRKFCMAVFLYP